MNKIQPLDQVVSIVASALNRTAKIRKNFESFFIETMILILTIYGKLNFLSMARHGESCESRFRQNFKKKFDWCTFNMGMLLEESGHRIAIALDHSFLCKSGKKKLFNVISFWDSSVKAILLSILLMLSIVSKYLLNSCFLEIHPNIRCIELNYRLLAVCEYLLFLTTM